MIKWQIVSVWVTLHHMQVDMHIFFALPHNKSISFVRISPPPAPLLQNHFEQDAILHGR